MITRDWKGDLHRVGKGGGKEGNKRFFLFGCCLRRTLKLLYFFSVGCDASKWARARSFLTRQKGYVGVMFRHHLALCARRARIINLIVWFIQQGPSKRLFSLSPFSLSISLSIPPPFFSYYTLIRRHFSHLFIRTHFHFTCVKIPHFLFFFFFKYCHRALFWLLIKTVPIPPFFEK